MTTSETINDCAGCDKAMRRAMMRPGVRVTCAWPGCTASFEAPWRTTSAPGAVPRVEEAMPAQRVAPPVATMAPCADRNRRETSRTWNAVADLELLARWAPSMDVGAAPMEPVIPSGSAKNGRSNAIDGHAREYGEAVLIARHLLDMEATPEGKRHAAVLRFAYLAHGPEWRIRTKSFAAEIGNAFVVKATREKWAKHSERALRKGLPNAHGLDLLAAACKAYER